MVKPNLNPDTRTQRHAKFPARLELEMEEVNLSLVLATRPPAQITQLLTNCGACNAEMLSPVWIRDVCEPAGSFQYSA